MLLVDPDPSAWTDARLSYQSIAAIEVCREFLAARRCLLEEVPDLLVTNLRLGAYNGLHLVYLAMPYGLPTRCVVYSRANDMSLIQEAQGLGAFFEWPERVLSALRGYMQGTLPARDRRYAGAFDRRRKSRGGRRAADLALVA